MSEVVIDSPQEEATNTWWFLDILVAERRTAPDMSTVVMEATIPLGASPPLHVHNDLDDTMYILDGEMRVRCGDSEQVVRAGHWVSMPRGVPHTFLVTGDRDARVLLVHDNDSFRGFVREVAVPAGAHVPPPNPQIPPMDDLARIAAAHDMTIIGPPMPRDVAASGAASR
jgi:quercetin dioxygenase-like cupin family protein